MTDRFAAFDRAIARTTQPFTSLADKTLTGLDAIQQRNQSRLAQIEKEKAAYSAQIQQGLGDG